MPIRGDLRKFYGAAWRNEVRPRILARAGDKCEQCGAPNHTIVQRAQGWWLKQEQRCDFCVVFTRIGRSQQTRCNCSGVWVMPNGTVSRRIAQNFPPSIRRSVSIRINICHLNHVAGDDRDENLRALCQWCHLNHDEDHHRDTRATRKDEARPLLAAVKGAA
jgi:hypothetical protein